MANPVRRRGACPVGPPRSGASACFALPPQGDCGVGAVAVTGSPVQAGSEWHW